MKEALPARRIRVIRRIETGVCLLLIILAELFAFNLAHWQTLRSTGYTADPSAVTPGPGLERQTDGGFKVSDPTASYLQTDFPPTRVRFAGVEAGNHWLEDSTARNLKVVNQVQVRVDLFYQGCSTWTRGGQGQVISYLPRSHYLRVKTLPPDCAGGRDRQVARSARLWVQEPIGSLIDIDSIGVNPQVPLDISPFRILTMAALAALILAFLPSWGLWRTRLDTARKGQRVAFWLLMSPVILWAVTIFITSVSSFTHMEFQQPYSYTYDFDQYAHLADSLLAGRPWLDMEQAPGLRMAANPYDIPTRNRLLAQDQAPIYWDYVYYKGHWYSYFGVLPALLLFLPYRAVTSLFVPGGLMLPPAAAAALMLGPATILAVLFVVALVSRFFPSASLATTAICILVFLTASDLTLLWNRRNFYTIPVDGSFLLTMAGLCLWLGARRVERPGGGRTGRSSTRPWTVRDPLPERLLIQGRRKRVNGDGAQPRGSRQAACTLSLGRLAAGTLCITANLASRQPFIFAGILALPIFSREIGLIARSAACGISSWFRGKDAAPGRPPAGAAASFKAVAAVILPMATVIAPLLAYNQWRFGSPLDFGNTYQLTVTNLNTYRPPLGNLPTLIVYYLFQPLSFIPAFPYLQLSPAPMPVWQYTEPGVGGLLTLNPALLIGLAALLFPGIRRALRRHQVRGLTFTALCTACLVMVFDAWIGGFSCRYAIDFSWMVALVAICAICAATTGRPAQVPAAQMHGGHGGGRGRLNSGWAGRLIPVLLVMATLTGVFLTLIWTLVICQDSDPFTFSLVGSWILCP